jgi:DNA invertase Pin-like site-specific DNA recombinase
MTARGPLVRFCRGRRGPAAIGHRGRRGQSGATKKNEVSENSTLLLLGPRSPPSPAHIQGGKGMTERSPLSSSRTASTNGTRAALYLRVSTASQSRYGDRLAYDQRPELQEGPLRFLADQRGWKITEVYLDRVSGAKAQRPGLDRLMQDARQRRFDVLMVWRFDRLSRSALHFLTVAEELRALGIDFVSYEQALDTTTPMGQFALTMFAALAELERQVIRDRVAAGMLYAKEHGTKSGRPIGRPRAIFRRDEVADLRRQGLSWRQIARRLGAGVGTVRRAFGDSDGVPEACQNAINVQRTATDENSGNAEAAPPVQEGSGFGTETNTRERENFYAKVEVNSDTHKSRS